MIRYRYASRLTPPAPFVNLAIRCPATDERAGPVAAQVDTAADRTVLPDRLVEQLALQADGTTHVQGFGGQVIELPLYLVEVQVHDLPPHLVRVLLGKGEPFVLLGRDVLNLYPILLDGPQLALEITPPTAG